MTGHPLLFDLPELVKRPEPQEARYRPGAKPTKGKDGKQKATQPPLFGQIVQESRRRSREEDCLFAAVVRLRKSGKTVYAVGLSHSVDGTILLTEQLLAAAAALDP